MKVMIFVMKTPGMFFGQLNSPMSSPKPYYACAQLSPLEVLTPLDRRNPYAVDARGATAEEAVERCVALLKEHLRSLGVTEMQLVEREVTL